MQILHIIYGQHGNRVRIESFSGATFTIYGRSKGGGMPKPWGGANGINYRHTS